MQCASSPSWCVCVDRPLRCADKFASMGTAAAAFLVPRGSHRRGRCAGTPCGIGKCVRHVTSTKASFEFKLGDGLSREASSSGSMMVCNVKLRTSNPGAGC